MGRRSFLCSISNSGCLLVHSYRINDKYFVPLSRSAVCTAINLALSEGSLLQAVLDVPFTVGLKHGFLTSYNEEAKTIL